MARREYGEDISPEAPPRPTAIIFDLDGTIADTEWLGFVVVRDAYRSHGLVISEYEWLDHIGRADNPPWADQLGERLGRQPDPTVIDDARLRYDREKDLVSTLPGVVDVIDAAESAGLPLAVATSSTAVWAHDQLERLGLRHRFAAVCTREDVERGKPAPDLFLAAAAALGRDPDGVLAIEDSRHGCRAAVTAGMRCVVVPNRITRLDLPDDATLIIDSLLDFPFHRFGMVGPAS